MIRRVTDYVLSHTTRTSFFLLLFIAFLILFTHARFSGASGNGYDGELQNERTPLTEIFFTDYLALPVTIQRGQTVPINFAVRNIEGRDLDYAYVVYLVTTSGHRIDVARGSVAVPNKGEVVVQTSYTFKSNSLPVTFFVELPTRGKRISAAVPVPLPIPS